MGFCPDVRMSDGSNNFLVKRSCGRPWKHPFSRHLDVYYLGALWILYKSEFRLMKRGPFVWIVTYENNYSLKSLHLCPTYCEVFARAVIEVCVYYAPFARPQWTSPADVQVIHGDGALQLREAVPIHSQIEFHVFVLFTTTDKISGATETSVQKIIDISAIMPRWWAALKAVVK